MFDDYFKHGFLVAEISKHILSLSQDVVNLVQT